MSLVTDTYKEVGTSVERSDTLSLTRMMSVTIVSIILALVVVCEYIHVICAIYKKSGNNVTNLASV